MVVTKIDVDGNVIWNHTYGYHIPTIITPQDNFDVFKLESNGYDLVEDNTNTGYLISGVAQIPGDNPGNGQPNHLFALHIDKDGFITNQNYYGDAGSVYYPKNITSDGTSYFLTAIKDGAPFVGMVYKIENNTNLAADWGGTTWNSGNQPVEFNNYACHDLIVHDNKLFVSAAEIIEGNCTFAGLNRGHFYFRGLELNSGNEILSAPFPVDIVEATAFDFKSGLTKTADGGIAFVTSARSPGVDEPDGTESDLGGPLTDFDNLITLVTDGNNNAYTDCRYLRNTEGASYAFGVWRTDTYIAKFNQNGFKIWETTFDSEDSGPENYPGDFKEQECVYHIVEGDDGGLVIVGNSSHNSDDYYMAKVFSDCQLKQSYIIEDPVDDIYEISTSTNWSSLFTSVKGTVIVKSGAVLTIENSLIAFADTRRTGVQTKIIVEKGGKLIINNSTLSSLDALGTCDKAFWDGIHVEGSATGTTQSNANQGYVEITDSRIENAIYGITTRAVDANGETDYSKTGGGVIKAKNTTFQDCYVALEFEPYVRYTSNNIAVSNVSYIRNCDFNTSDDFGDQSDITKPYAFIKNYGTYNIQIKGNRFVNERDELPPSQWGNGIISMDAGYSVNNLCTTIGLTCPIANQIKNEFYNLQTGIEINQGGASNFNVTVDDANFVNAMTGIRVNGGQFGKLINNDFFIPIPDFTTEFVDASGMYLNGAWGYRVENNQFIYLTSSINTGRSNGIIVEDSDNGGSGLAIYRNNFNYVMTGVETIGLNNTLQIDCNQFVSSPFDPNTNIFHADGSLGDQGLCVIGDDLAAQANEFSGPCDNVNDAQIYKNPIATTFEYSNYSSATGLSLQCTDANIIIDDCGGLNYSFSTLCPSNLNLSFPARNIFFLTNILQRQNEIANNKNLIDGGDTQGILNYLASTNNPGQIKNYLLVRSPYLSDEVLIAAIDKNLSPGTLKQILLANSSLSEKVMSRLDNYTLPTGIRNQINAAQNGTGLMIDLNNFITFLEKEKLYHVNDLVSSYLDSAYIDSAIITLQKYGNPQSLCALLPIVAKKDTTGADTLITKIQQTAQATLAADPGCKSCQDHLDFCDFQKLLFAVNSRDGGYAKLTDFEKASLKTISTSTSPIAANAHAILNFINEKAKHLNGLDYILPNGDIRAFQQNTFTEEPIDKIKIYPNPANDFITIEINQIANKNQIDIFDIYGKLIYSMNMLGNKATIDITKFNTGMYLIIYTNSLNEKISNKLVIAK